MHHCDRNTIAMIMTLSARDPAQRFAIAHRYSVQQVCERCGKHRIWVHEHQRGDASFGFVTHGYNVTHDPEPERNMT